MLNADVGLSEIDGFGIKVALHRANTPQDETALVQELISATLADDVRPNEIAVLGTSGVLGPTCSGLLKSLPDTLRSIHDQGALGPSELGIVSSITEFRGLEARVAILVDMDRLPSGAAGMAQLYMGMSRASSCLHIFVGPAFAERLRTFAKHTTE